VFEYSIMACIILNTALMAAKFFGQPLWVTWTLLVFNYVFAVIFTVEAILKLIALDINYFKDGWNIFDFVIVIGTDVGIVLAWTLPGVNIGPIATVVRTFRVGRIVRLINSLKNLRKLFNALIRTIPGLFNITAMLMLFLLIYACMGVQLFAKVQINGALTEQGNLQTFFGAVLLLIRSSTGENWNGIMHAVAARPDGCVDDPSYNPNMCGFTDKGDCIPLNGCGNPVASYLFFISFTLTVSFVLLNVFIAVILEGFMESSNAEDAKLNEDDFKKFCSHWAKYDTSATYYMPLAKLQDFFQYLPPPMGFGEAYHATSAELQAKIQDLNLRTYNGPTVFFLDVAQALSRRLLLEAEIEAGMSEEEAFRAYMPDADYEKSRGWDKQIVAKNEKPTDLALSHYYATMTLVATYRCFKLRRNLSGRVANQRALDKKMTRVEDDGEDPI